VNHLKFAVKRTMDVFLSVLALIVFSPLLIMIALAIKLDSKGSVFFRQNRLGKDGKVFSVCKFRTMIQNAEHMGDGLFNYEGDFRVTRVGRILRKTSMDEVPQLLNILKGEMSIVGPRPPVTYEHGDFKDYPDAWRKRFTMLPGVTGLAQISGRNELTWEEKIKYDDEYIDQFKKYGVLIDIKIMYITTKKIFFMTSIYEKRDNASKKVESEVTTE
jgi:lipopolysaccharide/colanic/teichoic acid biosynthesis glycosyltransferase